MSYFNKKEEVIDIELTSYGKRLLSQGKFRPAFYSFFDDDIIYDYQWAGSAESQNVVQSRITSSAYLKPQVGYTGLDAEVRKVVFENRSLDPNAPPYAFVLLPDIQQNNFVYTQPLGDSSLSSEYAPSWSILVGNSKLSSSGPNLTGSYQNLPIPQLNANIDFDLKYVSAQSDNTPAIGSGEYEILREFSDGSKILLKKRDIILQIFEQHTDYQRENFDIEVFEITSSVDSGICHYPESQYCFLDPDNLLPRGQQIEPSFVEYFLDILVDEEIEEEVLCDIITMNEERNRYEPVPPSCNDPKTHATNENVYELPVNSDDQSTYCGD